MSLVKSSLSRDDIILYIEAILIRGYTKKAAYLEFINDKIVNVSDAVQKLEKKKEFQDIYDVIVTDANYAIQKKAQAVKEKYVDLVDENISLMRDVLKDASKSEDAKTKATAVRLANETITAMSIVDKPTDGSAPGQGQLNKSSVIS